MNELSHSSSWQCHTTFASTRIWGKPTLQEMGCSSGWLSEVIKVCVTPDRLLISGDSRLASNAAVIGRDRLSIHTILEMWLKSPHKSHSKSTLLVLSSWNVSPTLWQFGNSRRGLTLNGPDQDTAISPNVLPEDLVHIPSHKEISACSCKRLSIQYLPRH